MVRILVMVVSAMTLIVIGDAAGKALTAEGVSPFFVAWSRFAVATVLLWPLLRPRRAELPALLRPRVLLRATLVVLAISAILSALRTEPLANVFGGFFVGPIVAFLLSALLLKERVTLPRAILLAIGFLGVLLVVQPAGGLSTGMMLAILAGSLHGSFLVATRWLAGAYRANFLVFSQLLTGSILLAPLGLAAIPALDSPWVLTMIAISALGSAAGNTLLVGANRQAPASIVAPLVYSQLVAATLVGYLAFGDWPDPLALSGLAVIITSGLVALWLAGRGR